MKLVLGLMSKPNLFSSNAEVTVVEVNKKTNLSPHRTARHHLALKSALKGSI